MNSWLPFFFLVFASTCGSLAVSRPVQEMSDTVAALRAAKEVSADTLAPEMYRKANEAYLRARNEYRFKNFIIAKDYALRAKKLAEEAEFEALKQGAQRTSAGPSDEPPPPPPEPYDYPKPVGTPGFLVEQEEAKNKAAAAAAAAGQSGMSGTNSPAPTNNTSTNQAPR